MTVGMMASSFHSAAVLVFSYDGADPIMECLTSKQVVI